MSFNMPDLIVESVLREGFIALKRNPELINDIFSSLTRPYASKKYGEKELERIKDMISKKDWSFVHSFGEVEANLPCISIQLGNETEDKPLAHIDDYEDSLTVPITDPDQLAALVKIAGIQPDSYDALSGTVYVPDSVNLSQVHINLIYVDAAGIEHGIIGGIVNEPGAKQFVVPKNSDVDISASGQIKSGIDYEQFEVRGMTSETQLLLGIHTKDALATKYIYILIKFILAARKKALIERGFICSSYQGSDFTRNLKYEADIVYTRYLTVSGKVQDNFRSDQEDIFDHINVKILVPKDTATTEDVGRETATVQVGETPQE